MDNKQAAAVATWEEIMGKVESGQALTTNEDYIYNDIIIPFDNDQMAVTKAVNFTVAITNA